MKITQEEKSFLSLSGEFGVCSELLKRGIPCSITYGNHKATDIIVHHQQTRTFQKIEVKTSKTTRIVTSFFQKYKTVETPHPDFWVVVHIDSKNISHYYILTHNEMADVQMQRNNKTEWKEVVGVDNIELKMIANFENAWDKIIKN